MAAWLNKVLHAVGAQSKLSAIARRALRQAQRDRVKLTLMLEGNDGLVSATSHVEQVTDDEVIVSQPLVGGRTQPLATGEDLQVGFVLDSVYHKGHARCLGRTRIAAGSGGAGGGSSELFAYRLSLPEFLAIEDRRNKPRVDIKLPSAPPAQLQAPGLGTPVTGVLTDISLTGARIRCVSAAGRITTGQEVFLRTVLPAPVGRLDQLVEIAHVNVEARSGLHVIGVRFRQNIEGLATLLGVLSRRG